MLKNKVKLNNNEIIAYQVKGHGEKVVILIHGNMCSSAHYYTLLNRTDSTAYTVYALDLRGFGDSTYHSPIETVRDLSDDIRLFMEAMHIKKISLVGWSAGGPVCMQFAIDYPDLVEGLILLNSVSHRGDPLQKKDASGRNTRDYYASKTEMSYDPEIAIPATAIRHHDFNTLHDMWHSGIYTNKKPADSMSQLLIKETMKQRNLEDMYWILAHFNISDQYNGYSQGNGKITQIQTHVLSYWGEQDQIVTLQDTKDTVEALPNARLRVLKNCGHSPLVDQLEEILAGMEEMF